MTANTDRFMSHLAVFVIVRNDAGHILLQQRANTGYLDGCWDFPSGHVEHGETIHEAAARELAEEAGITADADSLKLTHINQYFMDRDYVNFIFTCDSWRGTPEITEPEKCSGLGFFAIDNLPDQRVNILRVVEQTGFSDELTYSVTDKTTYEQLLKGVAPVPAQG